MKTRIILIGIACLALFNACEQMPQYIMPTVETLEATGVTKDAAVMNAIFTMDTKPGLYVRRAFEFSNAQETLSQNRYYFDDDWVELSGVQQNNSQMNGLAASTTYYFRAVLVPMNGELSTPIYGEVKSFTTKNAPPTKVTVTTLDATSVTSSTVRTKGTCTVQNGTIKKVGILISSKSGQTTMESAEDKSEFDSFLQSFEVFWYNITPGTANYFRAYAIDSENNVYYGEEKSFTTKTEPGGSLTQSDFVGTYTVNATSPWESKTVTWSDVQIVPYEGDTVVAIGWNGHDELRALGIFDKGMQVVRFESDWYFEALTFDVNGYTCVAMFMPAYYNSSDSKAYTINTGGKRTFGEIWLAKNGSSYAFQPCDGDSNEGYYANGFIFDYYTPSDWVKRGNSNVYTNVTMTRTSTATTKSLPARNHRNNCLKQLNNTRHENQTSCAFRSAAILSR